MAEPDWDMVADAGYSAYGLATGGKNFRGEPMPDWSALPERTRHAWKQAAIAIGLLVVEQASAATFTCPVCGMTSHHPEDVRHGYCGNCRRFQGIDET